MMVLGLFYRVNLIFIYLIGICYKCEMCICFCIYVFVFKFRFISSVWGWGGKTEWYSSFFGSCNRVF